MSSSINNRYELHYNCIYQEAKLKIKYLIIKFDEVYKPKIALNVAFIRFE
jgi:hypothetical protein